MVSKTIVAQVTVGSNPTPSANEFVFVRTVSTAAEALAPGQGFRYRVAPHRVGG